MATDGQYDYFSWQYGLEKTTKRYTVVQKNSSYSPFVPGIPASLLALGYDHIGDFDIANGIIYASLDSSTTGYNTPAVALFNTSDLSYTGTYYTLNPPDGTHDIASWFAVSPIKGLAFGMAYDNATEMAVYHLSNWKFIRYIKLSQPLNSVQGGKLFGGYMYMAANDSTRSVYRVNLTSGIVETLFTVKQDYDQEVEGLSVTGDSQGHANVHVLVVNNPNNAPNVLDDPEANVTLYHFKRRVR